MPIKSETISVAESGTAANHREKRKERRYPTNDPAEVRVIPDSMSLSATVIDVSRSGMRIELATPVPKGVRIEILMPTSRVVVFGEVRYCRRYGEAYHAGVMIEDVVQPKANAGAHVHEDEIALYVAGKGLNLAEVFRVEYHVPNCPSCRRLMVQIRDTLYPNRGLPPRYDPTM